MYVYSPKSLCGVLIFISVSRRLTKMFRKMVKDGVWQRCVWKMLGKMVCDKDMCERWCVTKLCVKDGVWQRCVWKMVCDQVVCERSCMKRWVWKMVYDQVVCVGWCVCVCKMVWDKDVCGIHHLSHKSFTHLFDKHHLSHTIFDTTSLTRTIFHTPSQTIFHTPHLCHTHNFATHHFVTHHLQHNHVWHLVTCTFALRGRRGTWRHLPAFGMAGGHFVTCTFILRGRPGAWRHLLTFGVTGVPLGDIYLRLAWQAWHLLPLVAVTFVAAWHLETSIPAFGVAGVALGDIYLRLAWQAWHLETSSFVWRGRRGSCSTWWPAWSLLVSVGRLGCGATLRGRHGTWRHLPSFHVAGVVLRDIYLHLAVTWRHLPAFGVAGSAPLCVAGMTLGDIYLRFT